MGMTNKRIVPIGKNIIVKKLPLSAVSEGGVMLPEGYKENSVVYGKVLAVGDELCSIIQSLIKSGLNQGDEVVFDEYAGKSLGDDVYLLEKEDILAKVVYE
jgi:co-chaperonin GroES (HSP10)